METTTVETNATEAQSFGERIVRTKFNPSGEGNVNALKEKTALLIDICQQIPLNHPAEGSYREDQDRLIAIAIEKYEEACMWAVKAATA